MTSQQPDPHTSCRSCDSDLVDCLSLGDLPLGNRFRSKDELGSPQSRHPLVLAVCGSCGLSQLAHSLDPAALHSQLLYFTSASTGLLEHERRQAADVMKRVGRDDAFVIEVGSSDGGLLPAFKERGCRVLGVEPMSESAAVAEERGIPTVVDIFAERVARDVAAGHGRADAIIANYVLELVPDPNDFMRAIAALLDPSGVALLEVPYLVHMVDGLRFDGIAHVRQTWLDVSSMSGLAERNGLVVSDVDLLPEYRGGTLRAWLSVAGAAQGPSVEGALRAEAERGVGTPAFLEAFSGTVSRLLELIPAFVRDLASAGSAVAGYGGGIKASTVINACDLGPEDLGFVVDVNPVKQDMYMPGPDIPIRSPQALIDERADYALLLALDHAREVVEQQSDFRRNGGRFVVPVPQPHVA